MDKFMILITAWWRHQMESFTHSWPFVRGIHRSPVNSPHKGQRRGALMFSLICVWINAWVNNREAGDFRCYHAHYSVTVMGCRWKIHNILWNILCQSPFAYAIYIIKSAVDIITLLPCIRLITYWSASLTRCNLVVVYGVIDLGQHLCR